LELWFTFPNCHIYTKLKGDLIHPDTCFLGLNQRNYPNGSNFLDLISSHFAGLLIDHHEYGQVQPDHFHPPYIIDCAIPVRRYKQNF
jgi:hypothetical protein